MIEHSLARYQQIAHLSRDIEQAFLMRDTDKFSELSRAMNELQEEAKADDAVILELLRQHDVQENAQIKEILALMQEIRGRNQRLALHINGIMAVQRNELQKMNKGTTLLKGYRSGPQQTGERISSSY